MPEPVVNEPKVVSQPKVWSDAPIIEEYESDSDDEHVSLPTKENRKHLVLLLLILMSHKALENNWIVDSRCSRHMTGTRPTFAKYQDKNEALLHLEDSKDYITDVDKKNKNSRIRDMIEIPWSKGIKR
ncbi:hypothetical protein Tco_0860434 [Tanacetum coccineum]|uniref:Uncharacterized protein n=1 Tax=Tanacetum coccineum TaxID=301880 RepID=A0ABQ5BI12_9ASTR